MSDTFYFLTKFCESNKNAVFHSDGDHYSVKCIMTGCGEIILSVKWVIPRRNLVKVELFTEDFKLISSQLRTGNEKEVSLTFCITDNQDVSLECNLMFIITIIPHVELDACPTSSRDHQEQLNLHDEIKDLSEDLLVGLAMDFRDLFRHGDLTDAVITNGSHNIKVHAAILLARSSVFRETLLGSSHEKIITIKNASGEALIDMITFIYSSFIKFKDVNRAEELYELAHAYNVEDLQKVCSSYMSNCTKDCVLRILILADKYKDSDLKISAFKIIVNNLRDIKSTEEWENFTNENNELAKEIFESDVGVPVTDEDTLREVMLRLYAKC